MIKNRILTNTAISLAILLVLGCVVVLVFTFAQSAGVQTPSQYAYQACRHEMLNTEGYGVWKLRSAHFLLLYAQYTFSDGYNDATCTVRGFGSHWRTTGTLQTLVGCVQSLDTGTDCPRSKFGVSP